MFAVYNPLCLSQTITLGNCPSDVGPNGWRSMVIAETGLQQPRKGAVERVFGFFLRILALYALISGLVYWAGLTGIAGDGAWRFDLLALPVRIVFTTLAVLMPAAALGLC